MYLPELILAEDIASPCIVDVNSDCRSRRERGISCVSGDNNQVQDRSPRASQHHGTSIDLDCASQLVDGEASHWRQKRVMDLSIQT